MQLLRNVPLLVLSLALSACAIPVRMSLTPENKAKITELKAHVIVVQDEVIAAVQPSQVSMATGGGLIGVAIDSAITNRRVKESQQVMGPFYASIEDVDYRKEFNEAVRRELAQYPIKITQVTTTPRAFNMAGLNKLRDQLEPGQALLVVWPRYYLTMDFRHLDAETTVSMWMKGSEHTPVHRAVLYYQSQPVGPGQAESVKLWAANNAALFRATLRESIVETLNLVLFDHQVPEAPTVNPESLKRYAFNTGASQSELQGQLVRESAGRTVVLAADKKLYSLPRAEAAPAK